MKIIMRFPTAILVCVYAISTSYAHKANESEVLLWGVDFYGSDIGKFEIPVSPQSAVDIGYNKCRSACESNGNCKAWTYVRPITIRGSNGVCYLKNKVPDQVKNNCCISGTLFEENTDRPGKDYSQLSEFSLSIPNTSKKITVPATDRICETICSAEGQCLAWTFVKANTTRGSKGTCYLKGSIPEAAINNCCTSGKFVQIK